MFSRKSTATWHGNGLEGKGALDMQSGVFAGQPYSFKTRFASEDGKAGTNPEELLGASHAGCFAMALSFGLTGAGFPPEELKVTATVTMDQEGVHFFVKQITLDLAAKVPGISEEAFQAAAKAAKEGCPISRALAATPIVLNAQLV